jgi:hypothetical protein
MAQFQVMLGRPSLFCKTTIFALHLQWRMGPEPVSEVFETIPSSFQGYKLGFWLNFIS